jgi:hypothetical protein
MPFTAGLDAGDRQVVERLFLAGHLNIIGQLIVKV